LWYGWILTGQARENLSICQTCLSPAAKYLENVNFCALPTFPSITLQLRPSSEGLRPKKMIPTEIDEPVFLDQSLTPVQDTGRT